MNLASPALAFARVLAAGMTAEITPFDSGTTPESGTVLLADRGLDDALLADLAARLPDAAGVVLWFAGRDVNDVAAALERHGFDHGAIHPVEIPDAGIVAILASDEALQARHEALVAASRPPTRALAIMPIFNEADVVGHAVGSLISHGVDVYVLDHRSTDGSADVLAPWLGRGLLKIERFPDECGYDVGSNGDKMVWREILRRVQDVSREVPADWHLFVNADEFRESPWPGSTLAEGLREVSELGFNAVNFELVNFMPTPEDSFVPGTDVRKALLHYEPPGRFDLLQIKAWNSGGQPADLVTRAGHSIQFEGRRVFGTPFILRHYPIRSAEHGARKVLAERMARFDAQERADGWHVQYDHLVDSAEFLRSREDLAFWDGAAFRASLLSRALRQQTLVGSLVGSDPAAPEFAPALLVAWIERCGIAGVTEAELQQAVGGLRSGVVPAAQDRISVITRLLASAFEAQATLRADMESAGALRGITDQAA